MRLLVFAQIGDIPKLSLPFVLLPFREKDYPDWREALLCIESVASCIMMIILLLTRTIKSMDEDTRYVGK
jgi:hypothetical protein